MVMVNHWRNKVVLVINARKHENNVFMYKSLSEMCGNHDLSGLMHDQPRTVHC